MIETIEAKNQGSFSEATRGLCPKCLLDVPARIFEESGKVWIEQLCRKHGAQRALIAGDTLAYQRLRKYVPDRVSGCCGAGETCDPGAPPTCVLLLEITQACNLRCPTCYADAHGHDFMTFAEAKRRLDSFFAKQPKLDVLMLSGGEPTIHPQFAEIVDLALRYPIERVLINTNGIQIAQSDQTLGAIAMHKSRAELFLSFSSFRESVHQRLYGKDLRDVKIAAVERAASAGVFVTIVPTVERGVNDDEIGDLLQFALSQPNINGINFQPVMDNGRYDHEFAPEARLSLTDVLAELEAQSGGRLRSSDFVGLPCSHPDCCALTYCILSADRSVMTPLPRHLDVGRYMDMFSDKISFSGIIGSALRRVWSDLTNLRGTAAMADLAAVLSASGIRDVLAIIGRPDAMASRILRVVVKPFMDAHTYDQKRIEQCCTKIIDETGTAVSFCEFNVLRRSRPGRIRGITLPIAVASID
jgi:uncharacterized radical SAM superfamily Fe-S cluster-containing enzyme